MVKGVDELIHFLLERIALFSGLSYSDIAANVNEFYSSESNQSSVQNSTSVISNPPIPKVDHRLLEKVWQWLTAHPEVRVETAAEASEHVDLDPSVTLDIPENDQPNPRYDGLVLRTTEKRIWHTLAGHDPDYSRLPKTQFELLRIIAAAGERGIIQPKLVKLSNQDKRSVPKRTDDLHQNKYIFKSHVRAGGELTSVCILRRFVHRIHELDYTNELSKKVPRVSKIRTTISDGLLHKESYLELAMEIIKTAGTISFEKFRKKMEMAGDRVSVDRNDPWLYQMELVGWIQTIRAKPSGSRKYPKTKRIKFLADITTETREAFLKYRHKYRHAIWHDGQPKEPDETDEIAAPTPEALLEEQSSLVAETGCDAPEQQLLWQPQRPLENQLYDIIHQTGVTGISTMEIVNKTTSVFAYRSIEFWLRTLSNIWQESQPPHLRHLAIIRDTSMEDGLLHYRYWSYPNFDLAVKRGLNQWDAVSEAYAVLPKTANGPAHKDPNEYLDEWGFPRVSISTLGYESQPDQQFIRNLTKKMKKELESGLSRILNGSRNKNPVVQELALHPPPPRQALPQKSYSWQKHLKIHTDFEKRVWEHANITMISENAMLQEVNAEGQSSSSIIGGTQNGDEEVLLNKKDQGSKKNHTSSKQPSRKSKRASVKRRPSEPGPSVPRKRQKIIESSEGFRFFQEKGKSSRTAYLRELSQEQNTSLKQIYLGLLHMSRPGLYIRPPQRIIRAVGRPKKDLLLVIKSPRLQELDWFRNSTEKDKLHLDSTSTFNIPPLLGQFSSSQTLGSPSQLNGQGLEDPTGTSLTRQNEEGTEDMVSLQEAACNTSIDAPRLQNRLTSGAAQFSPKRHGEADRSLVPLESRKRRKTQSGSTAVNNVIDDIRGHPQETSVPPPEPVSPNQGVLLKRAPHQMSIKEITEKRRLQTGKTGVQMGNVGVTVGGGSVARKRAEMVMQIVKDAGGAYPGANQIWLPFVTALQKFDPKRPDPQTIQRTIKNCVESGELKSLRFCFQSDSGLPIERSILCLPELDIHSDIVKKVERGMKRNYPEKYIPKGVEINNSLRVHFNSSAQERNTIAKLRKLHANAGIEESSVSEPDSFDTSDDESISEEQRTLQSKFQIDDVEVRPPFAPHARRGYGKYRDGKFSFTLSELPAWPVDVEGTPPPFSGHLRWVIAPETHAIEEHELLREEQAHSDEIEPLLTSLPCHLNHSNPNAWILSWSKISPWCPSSCKTVYNHWGNSKPRFGLCTTLTDPVQEFQPASGTFTTEFASIRDVRPKLRILTNIQREYEEKIPNSLLEIVKDQSKSTTGRRPKKLTFDNVVDSVQQWEQANEHLLSENSLMVPRFINYSVDQAELLQPVIQDALSKDKAVEKLVRKKKSTKRILEPRRHQVDPRLLSEPMNTTWTEQPRFKPMKRMPSKPSKRQFRRIAVTIVATQTLLNGIDREIRFRVISKILSKQEQVQIMFYWAELVDTYYEYLEKIEDWFQDAFITAYEKGEVPCLDYDDIEGYAWMALIKWAVTGIRAQVDRPVTSSTTTPIPAASDSEYADDSSQVLGGPMYPGASVGFLLSHKMTQYRREQLMNEFGFTDFQSSLSRRRNTEELNITDICMSFVRANLFTPHERYEPSKARRRFLQFEETTIESAIDRLKKLRVIRQVGKSRAIPGRNFEVSPNFYRAFQWIWDTEMFASAVEYKYMLDRKFLEEGSVQYSPHASDGESLAIVNLHAAGKLEIYVEFPPITTDPSLESLDNVTGDRYMSIWGLTEDDYKTKSVDLQTLTFPLRLKPSEEWENGVPSHDILPPAPAQHLDVGENNSSSQIGEKPIPLWYDIHDEFLPEIWDLLVAAAAQILSMFPGATAAKIVSILKGSVFEWEVVLLLEWMKQAGIARCTSESVDSFAVCEWWWAVLGSASSNAFPIKDKLQ